MMPIIFDRAVVTTSREEMMKRALATGAAREDIDKVLNEMESDEVFLSRCGHYQVTRRKHVPNGFGLDVICLSIKRVDKEVIHDWRDLQEIKNALVGPECEAIELYPAESRLVDTANQYWLWCFADPTLRIPVGFTQREVRDETCMEGTKQRSRK